MLTGIFYYWKKLYINKRYTNFACEVYERDFWIIKLVSMWIGYYIIHIPRMQREKCMCAREYTYCQCKLWDFSMLFSAQVTQQGMQQSPQTQHTAKSLLDLTFLIFKFFLIWVYILRIDCYFSLLCRPSKNLIALIINCYVFI